MAQRQLTPKQESFAQAVAGGLNQSDAYRLAYNTGGMAPATIWGNAHVLSKHKQVAARIQEIRDAIMAHKVWSKEQIVEELARNLENARRDGKWLVANQALEMIAQVEGLIPTPTRRRTVS